MKYKICLLLIVLFVTTNCKSQFVNTGVVVKMDGFMMNLAGKFIFQPCEDSSLSIWAALDNRSFQIWCTNSNDVYCIAMRDIGDSVMVKYNILQGTKEYTGSLVFFYCTIEINLPLIVKNKNDLIVFESPQYQLFFNDKKYPLEGTSISEHVNKIFPKEKKWLLKLYDHYKMNNYIIPQWLGSAVEEAGKS